MDQSVLRITADPELSRRTSYLTFRQGLRKHFSTSVFNFKFIVLCFSAFCRVFLETP